MNEMKQIFTILWVEDKPRVVSLNVKQLGEFFNEHYKDFKMEVIEAKTSKDIESNLKKQNVDIVVTDYNLEEDMDGLDVIKLIKKNGLLTDVLFYTAKKFDFDINEIYQKADHYGFIEVSEGTKEVAESVQKLIKKNLKRYEDIVFLRGMVISRIIDLELKVNDFFVSYFKIPKEKQEHFHNFILENQYNSLGGKVVTLENIIEKQGLKKQFDKILQGIRELANNRNLLAHCKTDPHNKNVLICMGKEKKFDKNKINEIIGKVN